MTSVRNMQTQWRHMRKNAPARAIVAVLGIICLGLGACGGGKTQSTQPTGANAGTTTTRANAADTGQVFTPTVGSSPRTVIARVGGRPVTLGDVEQLMNLASAPEPVPDPPSYSGCVARAETAQKNSSLNVKKKGEAELKAGCEQRYKQLLEESIEKTIHNQWLSGEAAEQGLHMSDAEVRREFEAGRKSLGSVAKFEAYRKETGRSVADILAEIRLNGLAQKIFGKIKAKEQPVTSADVQRFYASHRKQFAIPPGREVNIVRTATRGSAVKVKQQLEAGESFASVERRLSAIGQLSRSKSGTASVIRAGTIEEKTLNDAIFTAKLHRIYGPVQLTAAHKTIAPETNTGFFVLEVKRLVPGGQTPFAQVKAQIAERLKTAEKERTVPTFIVAYRQKWKAKTDCQPGYVVKYCSQFNETKAQEAVDPYTL